MRALVRIPRYTVPKRGWRPVGDYARADSRRACSAIATFRSLKRRPMRLTAGTVSEGTERPCHVASSACRTWSKPLKLTIWILAAGPARIRRLRTSSEQLSTCSTLGWISCARIFVDVIQTPTIKRLHDSSRNGCGTALVRRTVTAPADWSTSRPGWREPAGSGAPANQHRSH